MGKPLDEQAKEWTTGKFDIGEAPNPHALLFDHTKTISTLSIAFLGLSVGFSEKLAALANFPFAIVFLAAVWALLVISIILVLLASVGLHHYLFKPPASAAAADTDKYKRKYNSAAIKIGFSGMALALAAIVFAIFGGLVLRYSGEPLNTPRAMERALEAVSAMPQMKDAELRVDSLVFAEKEKTYRIVISDETSTESYLISIAGTGRTTNIQRQR